MGAEFIAESGVLRGLILSLEKGDEWVLGRDPDQCTIVIEDPKASRRALKIRKTSEGYFAENLSETNPVLVNNDPIAEPVLLHTNDKITIGGSLFHFFPEGSPADFIIEPEHFTHGDERTIGEGILSESTREEEIPAETIFEEPEISEMSIDLRPSSRFILKVIAGPNAGAEFPLDLEREYLIGTDTETCDIVFNDLSVSREHGRLFVETDGKLRIEDLKSRNGVVVDKERILYKKTFEPNTVVGLGTSAFIVIDQEAPTETIATHIFEIPSEPEKEKGEEWEEVVSVKEKVTAPAEVRKTPKASAGTLLLALIIFGLAIFLGIALVSLFQTTAIETSKKDYDSEIKAIVDTYPSVRHTFNKSTGNLFLMGHTLTGVERSELLHKLHELPFITGIEDNIVDDDAVWQEMNILLSKHPDFKGVSMHSPQAGLFVLSGYLHTQKQAADLMDYINLNFNYLSRLKNCVFIDEGILDEVSSVLLQRGMDGVTGTFKDGVLTLMGYIASTKLDEFSRLIGKFQLICGIRDVRNYVVAVQPDQGVIDLHKRFQGRYRVTGYSKHCDVNINVVVNGRIVTRGDCLDGMIVTSIQSDAIFLEKDGLKYKIEYNKCGMP